jgi:hypothetical protein
MDTRRPVQAGSSDIVLIAASDQTMMPPPPQPHCAFGSTCASRPDGQQSGPSICTYCANLSFPALYAQASTHTSAAHSLKRLVDAYLQQLERDRTERATKRWSHLCATKDPFHAFAPWRRAFDPRSPRVCTTVPHPHQLCPRCYDAARTQRCPWLAEWDGNRLGFPCVWEDARLRRDVDVNWKRGPVDAAGRVDPNWEKDFRRDGMCGRAEKRNQVCQRCFERMCEVRGFGRFFCEEWGVLRAGYGVR